MITNRIGNGFAKSMTDVCDDLLEPLMGDNTTITPARLEKFSSQQTLSVMDLGKLLLHFCKDGDTAKVHELMCRGAPFSTDWLGTSPIHLAAMHNHLETCEVLIRAGISKDAKTKVERTPLHFAVYEGHERIVKLLLTHKCEVDPKDMLKMTPLHWAVQKRHKKIVELLLENNSDPNVISKFGKTPLTIAYETAQLDVVKLLENAISNRIENSEQTQEATDRLVYEMQQSTNEIDQPDQNNSEPEYKTIYNHPDNENSNTNTNSIDDNNIIEDSDDGTSLSEAIIHLQNVEEPKTIDASTLQMLKEHGISMIKSDNTDNSLITSAIQSGRKLVLSEAGKIVLNDPKFRKILMDKQTTSTTIRKNQIFDGNHHNKIETKKPGIMVQNKNFPLTTHKVIKILSAEQFKQMCDGGLSSAFKKNSFDSGTKNFENKVTTGKVPTILHLNNSKVKKPVMSKTKLNINSSLRNIAFKPPPSSISMQQLNNNNNETYSVQTHDSIREIQTNSPSLTITREEVPLTKFTSTTNISLNSPTENTNHIPTMTILDMEKQILDLKKITEDLLKQYEISQKQNEELRMRIDRLERDRHGVDIEEDHQYNNVDEDDDQDENVNVKLLNYMNS